MQWQQTESLIYSFPAVSYKNGKVATFDMDGTIITTKSGKKFPINALDWKFWHDSVPVVLREYYKNGYDVVIISNQNGIEKGKTSLIDIKSKIEEIVKELKIPITVLLAMKDDHMRKPRIGTWEVLTQSLAPIIDTFYCGDAAGRAKDFAATDYKFALNLGIPFKVPEQLFKNQEWSPSSSLIDFDPRTIPEDNRNFPHANHQEIVLLCGPPASGKSTFANNQLPGYEVVCQDELRTLPRCVKACKAALNAQKSVIIDATNRNRKAREKWLELAMTQAIPIRCIVMDVTKELSLHLNKVRSLYGNKHVPIIAIHTYFKNYEPPTEFEDWVTWPFTLNNNANPMMRMFV